MTLAAAATSNSARVNPLDPDFTEIVFIFYSPPLVMIVANCRVLVVPPFPLQLA